MGYSSKAKVGTYVALGGLMGMRPLQKTIQILLMAMIPIIVIASDKTMTCHKLFLREWPAPKYKANEVPKLVISERVHDYSLSTQVPLSSRKPAVPNVVNGRIPRLFFLRNHPNIKDQVHLLAKEATYGEHNIATFNTSRNTENGVLLDYYPESTGNLVYAALQNKNDFYILRRPLEPENHTNFNDAVTFSGWSADSDIKMLSPDELYFVLKSGKRSGASYKLVMLPIHHTESKMKTKTLIQGSDEIADFTLNEAKSVLALVKRDSSSAYVELHRLNKSGGASLKGTIDLQSHHAEIQFLDNNQLLVFEPEVGRLSIVSGSGKVKAISETSVVANQRIHGENFAYDKKRQLLYFLKSDEAGHVNLVAYSIHKEAEVGSAAINATISEFALSSTGKVVFVAQENPELGSKSDALFVWSGPRSSPEILSQGKGPYRSITEQENIDLSLPGGELNLSNGFQLSPDGKMLVFSELKLDAKSHLKDSERSWYITNLEGSSPPKFLFTTHGVSQFFWSADGRMGALITRATPKSLKPNVRKEWRVDPNSNRRLYYIEDKNDDGYFTGAGGKDWTSIFD